MYFLPARCLEAATVGISLGPPVLSYLRRPFFSPTHFQLAGFKTKSHAFVAVPTPFQCVRVYVCVFVLAGWFSVAQNVALNETKIILKINPIGRKLAAVTWRKLELATQRFLEIGWGPVIGLEPHPSHATRFHLFHRIISAEFQSKSSVWMALRHWIPISSRMASCWLTMTSRCIIRCGFGWAVLLVWEFLNLSVIHCFFFFFFFFCFFWEDNGGWKIVLCEFEWDVFSTGAGKWIMKWMNWIEYKSFEIEFRRRCQADFWKYPRGSGESWRKF